MRKLSLFVLWIVIAGLALPGLAQSFRAPPLQPNELIVKTKDGCGIVMAQRGDSLDKHEIHRMSNVTWDGLCIDGLAMGEGTVHPHTRGWAWYGRPFGEGKLEFSSGPVNQLFFWDGELISYSTLDATKAVFENDPNRKSFVSDAKTMVTTISDPYQVYVINLHPLKGERYSCPSPQSPSGCDAIWAKHAGPVIANIKAFIAKNQTAAKAKKLETQALVEQFKARLAACEKEGGNSSSCPQTQPSGEQSHLRAEAQAEALKRAEHQEEENMARIKREAQEKVEREQREAKERARREREAEERARMKAEAEEMERQRKLNPPVEPVRPTGPDRRTQGFCTAEVNAVINGKDLHKSREYEPGRKYHGKPDEYAESVFEELFFGAHSRHLVNDVAILKKFAETRLQWAEGNNSLGDSHLLARCVALYKAAKLEGGASPSGGEITRKTPAPTPAPVSNILNQGKPIELSCGLPPSASAVKCLEAQCAKREGKLSLDRKGCAHCNSRKASDYWFICPTGVGGAR